MSPGFVALLGGNTPRLQRLSLAHAALKDGLGSALVRRLRGAKQREGLTGWTVSCFFFLDLFGEFACLFLSGRAGISDSKFVESIVELKH